jgi:hypothetical protein
MGETFPFFASRNQRAFEYNPSNKRTAKRLQDYLCENFWKVCVQNSAALRIESRGREART